jgi:hypothetical protein
MPRHLAAKSGWRILIDHLYGGPASIDLMMVVVQDSGTQFAAGQMASGAGRAAAAPM